MLPKRLGFGLFVGLFGGVQGSGFMGVPASEASWGLEIHLPLGSLARIHEFVGPV